MKRIYLTGDPALVEEYATLCTERGLAVVTGASGARTPASPKRKAGPAVRPPRTTDLALELTVADLAAKRERLMMLDSALPEKTPLLSASLTVSVIEQAGWVAHPERLAGIGALPTLLRGSLIELARSARTTDAVLAAAQGFTALLGKEHAVVADQVGMVLPRILCTLANEAHFALAEGVAAARDIDTAMMLGTNYPQGPISWAAALGLPNVLAILTALHGVFGDDRYRPAPLLRRLAAESRLPPPPVDN
jgi:3-hydroxybutyryl-CoA dehydrogenase